MFDLRKLTGLLLLFSVAFACSNGNKRRNDGDARSRSGGSDCREGDAELCECSDGSYGVSVCEEDEEFGPCECLSGSGGSSGSGSSGSAGSAGKAGSTSAGGSGGGVVLPPCVMICEFETSCHAVSGCLTGCADAYATGDSLCRSALDAWASCIAMYTQCSVIDSACSTYQSSVVAYCEAPAEENSCTFAYDGVCDEPSFCAAGTDTSDCATGSANSCTYAHDGVCDEPSFCATGTDTSDCSTDSADSCMYAHDGVCDEPSFCAIGTDTFDCMDANGCAYAFNDRCDEPSLCPMGTDSYDCAAQ